MSTLKLSAVTSFTALGLRHAVAHWPQGVRYAELYCFMQPDADTFLAAHSGLGPHASAIHHMARLKRRSDQSHRVVDLIAGKISKVFAKKGIRIVALATFLPEITCEDARRAGQAQEAMIFLLRLAHALNRCKDKHKASLHEVRAVELVAGGLLGSIRRVDEQDYAAVLRNRSETLRRLCVNLLPVVPECGTDPRRVCLAVEMEPGPLYVLGNWKAVKQLNALLDSDQFKELSAYVGFNLDIPHWAILSHIQPEHVRRSGVMRRLVHAHTSDHDKGHFCDNVLHFENSRRTPHDARLFRRWTRLLEQRCRQEPLFHLPHYSGALSCELEVSKTPEMIAEACRRAARILGLPQSDMPRPGAPRTGDSGRPKPPPGHTKAKSKPAP